MGPQLHLDKCIARRVETISASSNRSLHVAL